MKHIWNCRRMTVAIYAITLLALAMIYKGVDTSIAIASVAAAMGAANSYEKSKKALAKAKDIIKNK